MKDKPSQGRHMDKQFIGYFSGAQGAWWKAIDAIMVNGESVDSVTDPTSIGCTFGNMERPFQELEATTFIITNPRNRILFSKARQLNLPFLFANFVWTVSGSNRVETISHYNKHGLCFSDDGVTLASAFGAKIFGRDNQFERVFELLENDTTSRRAVIDLFDVDALKHGSRDISCAIAMQFLVRAGALDCIVYMRSQSAVMVLPYDLFLFTMLQEAMATRLGLPLGRYQHICGSLHYYKDEEKIAQSVHSEGVPGEHRPMPQMSSFSEDVREKLVVAEEILRPLISPECRPHPNEVRVALKASGLDGYWLSMFATFFGNEYEHLNRQRRLGAVHT